MNLFSKGENKPPVKNIMEAKGTSKTPDNYLGEVSDNSLSAGATNIEIIIDEKHKRIIHKDNGEGIADVQTVINLHQPYSEQGSGGINKFGIGSKCFYCLAPRRFVLSRHLDPISGKEKIYFAYWDLSSDESAELPTAIEITSFSKNGKDFEIFKQKCEQHGMQQILQEFKQNEKAGLWTILVDVELPAGMSYSKLYKNTRELLGLKYGFLKRHKFNDLDITVAWIDGKGKEKKDPLNYVDPFHNMEKSTLNKNTNEVSVHTFLSEDSRHNFPSNGIQVYRCNIWLCTVPFRKLSNSKVVKINESSEPYRLNHERQVLLYNAAQDVLMKTAETKNGAVLPEQTARSCADSLHNIRNIQNRRRFQRAKKVLQSKAGSLKKTVFDRNSVPFSQEFSSLPWRISSTKESVDVNEESEFYSLMISQPESMVKFVSKFLDSVLDELHTQTSKQKKKMTTEIINSIGARLEEKIKASG